MEPGVARRFYGQYTELTMLNGCCSSLELSSTIIRDLDLLCKLDEANAIAYWYFSFSESGTLNLGNSLSSLLRQLCSVTNVVPTSIQDLWKRHNFSGSRPSNDFLLTVLDEMIDEFARESREVFLVLDALDECPARLDNAATSSINEKYISLRSEVLDTLMHLADNHSNLRIIATSRKEVDIQSRFESQPCLNIEDHVSDDLDIFVRKSLDKIIETDNWKGAYRSEIQSRLVSAEDERYAPTPAVLCTRSPVIVSFLTPTHALHVPLSSLLANYVPIFDMLKSSNSLVPIITKREQEISLGVPSTSRNIRVS